MHVLEHLLKNGIIPVKFLNEVVAEFLACELSGCYKTTRSAIGTNLTSDWYSEYNMTYQQLGDEFLQTLPFINTEENNTDRKRFRLLTAFAIESSKRLDFEEKVRNEYSRKNPESGLADLTNISFSLYGMMDDTTVPYEKESNIREMLAKYRKIHISKRRDTNPILASAIDATEQQTTTGEIEGTATRRLRIAVPKRESPDNDKTK